MMYGGKELSEYTREELETISWVIVQAEAKRSVASQHVKFNEDREVNNKKIPKMEFPPANPEFLKLKEEIGKVVKCRKIMSGFIQAVNTII